MGPSLSKDLICDGDGKSNISYQREDFDGHLWIFMFTLLLALLIESNCLEFLGIQ